MGDHFAKIFVAVAAVAFFCALIGAGLLGAVVFFLIKAVVA